MNPARRALAKVGSQLRLLRRDPEAFGRNLLQVMNPALFEQRLVDVMHAVPMHVRIDDAPLGATRLNVLDTSWSRGGMTGGPNTVLNLAVRIARAGIAVRLVSTVETASIDAGWLRQHLASLVVGGGELPEIPVASAGEEQHPLPLGRNDLFLATHWTTAQQLVTVLPRLPQRRFFYMLQEYEPAFYAWSSNYARVIETYGMDFWPIVNEGTLADYFFGQGVGRFAEPALRDRTMVFEPAVEAAIFHAGPPDARPRPKRLLFYARPTNARNMFGLGLMALRAAAADPSFAGWEFMSIGSRGSLPDLALEGGHVLRRAPWMDYAGYGELLRRSDVVLCPMLSPHTSYPVLEMAACGGVSVTNSYATKTREALAALSDNIVAVEATVAGFAEGLRHAARRVNGDAPRAGSLNLARSWDAALDPVARRVAEICRSLPPAS